MPKLKLTKTAVDALPFTERGQVVYQDTQLTGFGVYVGKTSKTYFAQRQIGAKTCRVVIGGHGVFAAEQARNEARTLLMRMAKGEDPNAEKRSRRFKEITLRQTLDLYLDARRNLRPFTRETYRRIIETHLKDWADSPMAEILPAMVLDRHAKLGALVGKPTANNVMRVLRAIYNFAMVMDALRVWNASLRMIRQQAGERCVDSSFLDYVADILDRAEQAGFGYEHIAAMAKILRGV